MVMETFKVILAQRNIRQRTIAVALGVSDNDVSLWVNGKRDIPACHIKPLAKLLKLPIGTVLAMAGGNV